MINRLDFVKKFELIVKQEIKNYQDSFNSLLQSIRNINLNIDKLKETSLKTFQGLIQKQKDSSREIDVIKENIKFNNFNIEKIFTRLCVLKEECLLEIKRLQVIINRNEQRISSSNDELEELKKLFYELKDDVKKLSINVSQELNSISYRFNDDLLKTKESFKNYPCSSHNDLENLKNTISERHIDVDGILKELKIYKKDHYIISKKLEHIYTLIDRLQKRGD
jgi:hypothetical protein